MKKILFVAYGGGHITNLVPLIKKLQQIPAIQIDILAINTAQTYLDNLNIKYFTYQSLPFDLPEKGHDIGETLFESLDNKKLNKDESIAYLGWNILDLMTQFGEKEALDKYHKEGRTCFYPIHFMKRFLNFYKPDVVFATSAPRSERAALDAAKRLKIPAICITDPVVNRELDLWISDYNFCDAICVPNQTVKQKLISKGRNVDSIFVTGSPALEDFMQPLTKNESDKFRDRLKLSSKDKVILYAPSPESQKHAFENIFGDEDLPKKILNFLIDYLSNKSNIKLIFRPHPSQSILISTNRHPNVILDNGFDLKSVISCSNLVITTGSTVGVQSLLLNKPLICMNMSIYAKDIFYEDYGPCHRVNDFKELEITLNKEISQFNKIQKKSENITNLNLPSNNIFHLLKKLVPEIFIL